MRDAGTSVLVATSPSLQECKKKNAARLRNGSLSAANVINNIVVPNYGSSDVMLGFYRCTVNIEIYAVPTPTNALFINLVKSLKFTLKYTILSLLHVSVFNDHHQGALSVPN